ncbi:outer membrane beta-barrel protein [Flavobacterium psychrotrophum]|uniref:outer membrane beta-barrel protein n=1 Tax=Flavobacterium psychrotrophum TaxID=2294119 RepID=UPI000E30DD71|nr:outer membrane beta-barrel protein [Flavobacterium psychrotrophum]
MKKILFSVSALLAFGVMSAQEESSTPGFHKGDAFITGSVSFNSQKTGEQKNNGFTIAPSAAYFVSNNIAIGATIRYAHNKYEVDDVADSKSTASGITAGLFGRYYFTPENRLSFFGHLEANYTSSKVENLAGTDKANGFGVLLGPGVNYFISDHFALETTFGAISYGSRKPDGGTKTDNFAVNLNLSNIYLGAVYKF